jgi:nitrogen fixation NifU-like protein
MKHALYSKKIMEHFRHPRNMGRLKNPDGVGEAGNIQCGDLMKLYIKVKKDKKTGKEKISDIKFECLGCTVAIANTSLLTTMAKGKSLNEVMKIEKEDILKELGQVPFTKIHCSVLATDALSEAIYDYYKRNNLKIPKYLFKKHERIKQTVETLEKRHAEYIEFERKIFDKNK